MKNLKKLTINEWERIADWIKLNTCGCVYGNFKGNDLKEVILKGYQALYDYYDDFDLDVIAICCDVTEYEEDEIITDFAYLVGTLEEFKEDYKDIYDNEEEFKEEFLNEIVKELENKSHIIKLDNGSYLVWEF